MGTKWREDARPSPPEYIPFGSQSVHLFEAGSRASKRKDVLCWNMSGRGSAFSSAVLCQLYRWRLYQLHKREGLRIAMPTFDFGELSSYSNPSQTHRIRSLVHCFTISLISTIIDLLPNFPTTRLILNMYTISALCSIALCLAPIVLSHPLEE